MNRTLKIILFIAGGALVLMMSMILAGFIILRSAGWVLTHVIESEPGSITEVGRTIADYDLPDRYIDAYAASVADFSMVAYHNIDDDGHIFLLQLPDTIQVDPVDLEQQMRRVAGTEELAEVVGVHHIPCRIRGQEATLVISEGFNHENKQYRSASVTFRGKGGQALINISAPAEAWDQAMVQTFVESFQ